MLRSCAKCDAILVEAREIAVSVAALAAHDKAVDAAGHLEFTLRAAFAREHGGSERLGDLKGCPYDVVGVECFPRCFVGMAGVFFGWCGDYFCDSSGAGIRWDTSPNRIVWRLSRRKRLRPPLRRSRRLRRQILLRQRKPLRRSRRNISLRCTNRKRICPSGKQPLQDFLRCPMPTIFRRLSSARLCGYKCRARIWLGTDCRYPSVMAGKKLRPIYL